MPDDTAASAMRSHHSAGASGTWPVTLIRSGWASTSHERDAASSSMAVVYASQQSSTWRADHSAIDTGSSRSSKRQPPTQCTDPSSTSKG